MNSIISSMLLTAASLSVASAVPVPESADSSAHGLLSVHSGDTRVHLREIKVASNSILSLNGDQSLEVEIGDDGTAKISGTDQYLQLYQGRIEASQSATPAFSNKDGSLAFSDKSSFIVCFNDNYNIYYSGEGVPTPCTDYTGINILLV